MEKDGELSQDEKFKAKEDIQKHVDAINRNLEVLFERKEAEISQ
jgi:ribosome recycling factor